MGAAKHELMRYEEERWAPTGDERKVCKECFEDDGLKKFILAHSTDTGCDFCDDDGAKRRKSIDIDTVIEFIAGCINREYSGPEGILQWDQEEGGYMGESLMESSEFLIQGLVESKHSDVVDVVASAFDDTADWVHVHALQDSPGATMTSLWNRFADSVKHERRFFFKRPSKANVSRILDGGPESPSDILTTISQVAKKVGLFRYVPKGQKIFRARKYSKNHKLQFDLENFGVPSREVSKQFANRMSPAGIPIFYGSECFETAKKEVAYAEGSEVGIVSFVTNKGLLVLDLTLIPPPPSIFQESDLEMREAIWFLNMFRKEIMKDIDRKGHEHVDYIPSQIFTEFIRYRVKHENKKIDGVVFPSAKKTNKKNFALFCDNTLILPNDKSGKGSFLKFIGKEVF